MSQLTDLIGRVFKGKRISMLGLKNSGKSQFLKSLGCEDAKPGLESQMDEYDWFKVVLPNKSVFVKAGYDYGGGHEIFMANYNKALISGSYVFFLIDMKVFFDDGLDVESGEPYRDVVFRRLDYINSNSPKRYFDKVAIVLTHKDLLCDSGTKLINMFQQATGNKPYSILTKRCYAVDTTNKEDVLEVFRRIL